jgi:hypothetical protein
MKLAAAKHLGSQARWLELQKILNSQGGRCAYSGRRLELGENASIEHVEPKSKNAARRRDITNLKFVDRHINVAKASLSLGDFLKMCKEVLTHFGWEVVKDERR